MNINFNTDRPDADIVEIFTLLDARRNIQDLLVERLKNKVFNYIFV